MSALSRRASSDTNWTDWRWQQSSAARSLDDLLRWFPNLDRESCFQITLNSRWVRFQLTPYLLSLVAEVQPGRPNPRDPIWKQYVPTYEVPPVSGSLAEHLREAFFQKMLWADRWRDPGRSPYNRAPVPFEMT